MELETEAAESPPRTEGSYGLTVGTMFELDCVVDGTMNPGHVGGSILSTPSLVAVIERTCRRAVLPVLRPVRDTVGTHVDVSHEGVARLGETIKVTVRLAEIRGRRLDFEVLAAVGPRVVSRGRHQRAVVDKASFGKSSVGEISTAAESAVDVTEQ